MNDDTRKTTELVVKDIIKTYNSLHSSNINTILSTTREKYIIIFIKLYEIYENKDFKFAINSIPIMDSIFTEAGNSFIKNTNPLLEKFANNPEFSKQILQTVTDKSKQNLSSWFYFIKLIKIFIDDKSLVGYLIRFSRTEIPNKLLEILLLVKNCISSSLQDVNNQDVEDCITLLTYIICYFIKSVDSNPISSLRNNKVIFVLIEQLCSISSTSNYLLQFWCICVRNIFTTVSRLSITPGFYPLVSKNESIKNCIYCIQKNVDNQLLITNVTTILHVLYEKALYLEKDLFIDQLFTDFEASGGYQVFMEIILKHINANLDEHILEFIKRMTDILIFLSFYDPENKDCQQNYKQGHKTKIVFNMKSIQILILFFVESQNEELNLIILETINNLIKENSENFKIFKFAGILDVLIDHSKSKSECIQEQSIKLFELILSQKNENFIPELNLIASLINANFVLYSIKFLKLFLEKAQDTYFYDSLRSSDCYLSIGKKICEIISLKDNSHRFYILLYKVLINMINEDSDVIALTSKTSIINVCIKSLLIEPFSCLCSNLLSLLIQNKSADAVAGVIDSLKTCESDNFEHKSILIKILNTSYNENRELIKIFLCQNGFIHIISELLKFEGTFSTEVTMEKYYLIFDLFGLLWLSVDNINLCEETTINLTGWTESLLTSVKLLGCFSDISTDQSIQLSRIKSAKVVLYCLFSVAFGSGLSQPSQSTIAKIIASDNFLVSSLIKLPEVFSLILSLFCDTYLTLDSLNQNSLLFLWKTVLEFIGNSILTQKLNVNKLAMESTMERVTISLLSIWMNSDNMFFTSVSNILSTILVKNCFPSLLTASLTHKFDPISLTILNFLMKYRYKSLQFSKIRDFQYIHADSFINFPIFYSSTDVSEPFINISRSLEKLQVYVKSSSDDALDVEDNNLKDILDLLDDNVHHSASTTEVPELLEDISPNVKGGFIENLTANSDEWKKLKNVIMANSGTQALQYDINPSSNFVINTEKARRETLADSAEEAPIYPIINQKSYFLLDNLTELIAQSIGPSHSQKNNSYYEFKSNKNENAYIVIPKILKAELLLNLISGFDNSALIKRPDSEISFSIWFQIENKNFDNIEDIPLILFSLLLPVDQKDYQPTPPTQFINYLTIAYFFNWQTLVVSLERKDVSILDLIDRVKAPNWKWMESVELKEKVWYNACVSMKPSFRPGSLTNFSIYINGTPIKTFRLSFPTISSPSMPLTVYIGSYPRRMYNSPNCWRLGSFYLSFEKFDEKIIGQILKWGPDGISLSSKIQRINHYNIEKSPLISDMQSLEYNHRIVSFISPYLFETKITNINTNNNLNSYYKSSLSLIDPDSQLNSNQLICCPNPAFSLNERIFANRLLNPASFIYSPTSGNIMNYSQFDLSTVLHEVGGVNILILMLEKCNDTEDLFKMLQIFFKQVITFTFFLETVVQEDSLRILSFILQNKRNILNFNIFSFINFSLKNPCFGSNSILRMKSYTHLILDLELWFGLDEKIDLELLNCVFELLLESSDPNHFLTKEFIEESLINSLLNCVMKYEINNPNTILIYKSIIQTLLNFKLTQTLYDKLFLFIYDSILLETSTEYWSRSSTSITNLRQEISICILNQISDLMYDLNHEEIFKFNSAVGLHYFSNLMRSNLSFSIIYPIFKVMILLLNYHFSHRLNDSKNFPPSNMYTAASILSKYHPKIIESGKPCNFNSIFYYLGRVLAKTCLPVNTVVIQFLGLWTNGSYINNDIQDPTDLLDTLLQFPIDAIRNFSKSKFYASTIKDGRIPDFYHCPHAIITLVTFLSLRFTTYIKNLTEFDIATNDIDIQTNIKNILSILSTILQVSYFVITTKTEMVKVCVSGRFLNAIICILAGINKVKPLEESKKPDYLEVSEWSIKVVSQIMTTGMLIPSFNSFSSTWNTVNATQYPQYIIYNMALKYCDTYSALEIVSQITNHILGDICSDPGYIKESLSLNSSYIICLSNLIEGCVICYDIPNKEFILNSLINILQSLIVVSVSPIPVGGIPIKLNEFFTSFDKYLIRLLTIELDDITTYPSKIGPIVTIICANSHYCLSSSNSDLSGLRIIIELLFNHYWFLSVNRITVDDAETKSTLYDISVKLENIWELIYVEHKNILKETVVHIISMCDSSNLLFVYKNDAELSYSELSKFSIAMKKISNSKTFSKSIFDQVSTNYNFNWDDKLKEINSISLSHITSYHNAKKWYQWFSSTLHLRFKTYLSEFYHLKSVCYLLDYKKFEYITESLYHEGSILGTSYSDALQRWESITGNGIFSFTPHYRKNDKFYYNYMGKYVKIFRKSDKLEKTENYYFDLFTRSIQDYATQFSSQLFKDGLSKHMSFLSIETYINPVVLLKYKLKNENIKIAYRTVRISKIDAIEGITVVTDNGIFIIDGLTISMNKIIIEDSKFSSDNIMPIADINTQKTLFHENSFFSFIPLSNIKCIRKRRYSLMSIGIEIFDFDSCNYFLVFSKEERIGFIKRMSDYYISKKYDSALNNERKNLYRYFEPLAHQYLDKNIDSARDKWVNRKIDNFDYLMQLNVYAGRSFNDLTQYPVFPWVLADYASNILYLNDEKSFRDLSKPMGALDPDRLETFIKRFKDWDSNMEGIPPFYYATFYSTSMTICSLLVRMEPYSSVFLELQGGSFDLPDRMFNSVAESWNSASKTNTADVKELCPEFYFQPGFLVNSNRFNFGAKQNGTFVDDVILPPWAKSDPLEFIRLHRAALESEYVSTHLHGWIDLIFGYKQTGRHAIKNHNIFHSWFYKGEVKIENITDTTIKKSIMSFINNFGQVPKKIFSQSHPQRKPADYSHYMSCPLYMYFDKSQMNFTLIKIDNEVPINQMIIIKNTIRISCLHQIFLPPDFNSKISWERADGSISYISDSKEKYTFSYLFNAKSYGSITCASVISIKYIAFGFKNGIVGVWNYYKKQEEFSMSNPKFLYSHKAPISCVAGSSVHKYIVSGSKDGELTQWDIIDLTFIRKLKTFDTCIKSIFIIPSTGSFVVFQERHISVYYCNGNCLATVNTNNPILCGTTLNNPAYEPYQIFVTGSHKGLIEFWRFGFPTSSNEDVRPQQNVIDKNISDGWVECNLEEMNDDEPDISKNIDPNKRLISKFRSCFLYSPEEQLKSNINILYFDQSTRSLYSVVDTNRIYRIDDIPPGITQKNKMSYITLSKE